MRIIDNRLHFSLCKLLCTAAHEIYNDVVRLMIFILGKKKPDSPRIHHVMWPSRPSYIPRRAYFSSPPRLHRPRGPPILFGMPSASYCCDPKIFGSSGTPMTFHEYRRWAKGTIRHEEILPEELPCRTEANQCPGHRKWTYSALHDRRYSRNRRHSGDESHKMINEDCAN